MDYKDIIDEIGHIKDHCERIGETYAVHKLRALRNRMLVKLTQGEWDYDKVKCWDGDELIWPHDKKEIPHDLKMASHYFGKAMDAGRILITHLQEHKKKFNELIIIQSEYFTELDKIKNGSI